MKTRVIVSNTEREISPWLASVLSLLITGLGEFYAGAPFSGIILSLSRIMAILAAPFYSSINSPEPMTGEILLLFTACILITLFSPFHSFIKSRNKKGVLSWYNSSLFYLLFTLVSIILTVFASAIFISFFKIQKIDGNTPPLFRNGDLIAVKKFNPSGYLHGDMVVTSTDNGLKIMRVIGVPGEKISCEKGRFRSDGSELPRSIFSEEELKKLSLTDYDVVSEQNGKVRYPVKSDASLNLPEITLAEGEFILAPDIRSSDGFYLKTSIDKIPGRIDGILYSHSSGILPGGISLPDENVLTSR